MAEESVIYPSEPLFMVDRSWQRCGKGTKTLKSSNNSSRVPDMTITKLATKDQGQGRGKKSDFRVYNFRPVKKQATVTASDDLGSIQFHNETRNLADKFEDERQHAAKPNPNRSPDSTGLLRFKDDSFLSQRFITNASSALYTIIASEVRSFQTYLTYYQSRLAAAMYPLTSLMNAKYNTLIKFWLPVAAHDEVFLHTILFASALHFYSVSKGHDFKDSDLLMKVILDRLNSRLKTGQLSDATIGAVSCLAICDSFLGKTNQWAMHLSGMAEMIRMRGGMSAIQPELRMKIYRADMVGSIQNLRCPVLPLLTSNNTSLNCSLGIDNMTEPTSLQFMLKNKGLQSSFIDLFVRIAQFSIASSAAIAAQTTLDPQECDERLMAYQQSLLCHITTSTNPVESTYALATLIFLQATTSSSPYTKEASETLSLALYNSLRSFNDLDLPSPLAVWVLTMGCLVANETPEMIWFRAKLNDHLLMRSNIETWEQLKLRLKLVMWIDSIHDPYGEALWSNMRYIS